MASRGLFTANDAQFPSTNSPQMLTVHSTEQRLRLAYDASTDEAAAWDWVVPQGITGTITAIIKGAMASATSGAIGLQVSVEAITAGDAVDTDSSTSYDTVNNSASTTVPGTAGYEFEISITLSSVDSWATGDSARIKLNRDADGSAITDSAAGDFYFRSLEIRDGA